MAYKPVRFDLRKRFYRREKDYYREIREGRIPEPRYKKPKLYRIKLDPKSAILTACAKYEAPGAWMGGPGYLFCTYKIGAGLRGPYSCAVDVRGNATGMADSALGGYDAGS